MDVLFTNFASQEPHAGYVPAGKQARGPYGYGQGRCASYVAYRSCY